MESNKRRNTSRQIKGHLDIKSGKIIGCKPGTWKYYHEEGHKVFSESSNGSTLQLISEYLIKVWFLSVMFAIAYKSLLFLSVILWLIFTIIELYEEYWCNKYASVKAYKY